MIEFTHGLAARRKRNKTLRKQGIEPSPGYGAGVKRWARYHDRVKTQPFPTTADRELRYMHSAARRQVEVSFDVF